MADPRPIDPKAVGAQIGMRLPGLTPPDGKVVAVAQRARQTADLNLSRTLHAVHSKRHI